MKKQLGLRTKIVILFIAFVTILVSIITVYFVYIIDQSYNSVETKLAEKDMQQIFQSLKEYTRNLSTKNYDWSNWDDTYYFAANLNKDYVESNLNPYSLFGIGLNSLIITNTQGEIIAGLHLDRVSGKETKIPDSILSLIKSAYLQNIAVDSSIEGLVILPEGPAIISARPILTSSGEGPSLGVIVFIRFLDSELINRISDSLLIKFDLSTLPVPQDNQNIVTLVENSQTIRGEILYPDIYGKYVLKIVSHFDRQINSINRNFIIGNILFIVICSTLFLFIILHASRIFIVKPFSDIVSQLIRISQTKNISSKISSPSKEEIIQNIVKIINNLFASLENTQNELENKLKLIGSQNDKLENAQKASLNLLEDARSLEEQLKNERDWIKTIIATMGEGLIALDKNFNVSLINSAAEHLLNLEKDTAIGKSCVDISTIIVNGQAVPFENRTAIISGKTQQTFNITLEDGHYCRTNTGRTYPIIYTTTPIPQDRGGGVIIVFRDGTEQKEQKQTIETQVAQRTLELRQKNEDLELAKAQIQTNWIDLQHEKVKLTASLNSLSQGFILTDINNNVLFSNNVIAHILGIDEKLTHLKQFEDIIGPKIDFHNLHLQCQQEKRSIYVGDIYINKKNLNIYLTPIVAGSEQKECIGIAILIQDVTEEKILARSREEFFSIASHELRTPLTAIRGNTSMIMDYYHDKISDPELSEMVKDIHQSSIRLIGIVNDFLDISRVEQKRITYKKESFDIRELITEVLKEYESVQPPPSVPLVFNHIDECPQVVADRDRVKQVYINLLGNALKFTSSGQITTNIVPLSNSLIEISVTDTGSGIPETQQVLLFRKFQQAGSNIFTRDTTKGTGLGLYISRLLVEGMGGSIYLTKSEPGVGSTFSFTLPTD